MNSFAFNSLLLYSSAAACCAAARLGAAFKQLQARPGLLRCVHSSPRHKTVHTGCSITAAEPAPSLMALAVHVGGAYVPAPARACVPVAYPRSLVHLY